MPRLSRSLAANEEERGSGRMEEDEDEEKVENEMLNFAEIASATGTSVKEDLCNLTKTFTRQLLGVASFLAPPPPERSSGPAASRERGVREESQLEQWVLRQGNGGKVRSSSVALESGLGFNLESIALNEFNPFAGGGTPTRSASTSNESCSGAITVSPHYVSVRNAVPGWNGGVNRPKLTGLRSDFAELRGTVASGILRITSVLREVTGDDEDSSGGDDEREEELSPLLSSRESSGPQSTSMVGGEHGAKSPRLRFNAFLKPLFGDLLMREASPSSLEPTFEGRAHPGEDDGVEKTMEAPGKGEYNYRELESLPPAIASGTDGISKYTSSLVPIVGEGDDEDKEDRLEHQDLVLGLTEVVVNFARNIATHPQTWLDFPLTHEEFELSTAQSEHLSAVEIAAPGLKALKIEICPSYMTEQDFWKIYFVVMHFKLSSNEFPMLSSEQVVEACTLMLQELQRRESQTNELDHRQDLVTKVVERESAEASQQDSKQIEEEIGSTSSIPNTYLTTNIDLASHSNLEDAGHVCDASGVDQSISGSVEETHLIQSRPDKETVSMLCVENENDVDGWPDEEPSTKQHKIGDPYCYLDPRKLDEDVSFSDLEEEDSSDRATSCKEAISWSISEIYGIVLHDSTATAPLRVWEALSYPTQGDGTPRKSSERVEFNDWLKVDQDDIVSAGSP